MNRLKVSPCWFRISTALSRPMTIPLLQEIRPRKALRSILSDEGNNQLKGVIDLIASGHFSSGDPDLFKPLFDSLLYHDEYLLFADFQSYVDCQDRVSQTYRDKDTWTRMSILNVARMGKFSSGRTIRYYCDEIWKVKPVPVSLEDPENEET